jgi:hypothetical protein
VYQDPQPFDSARMTVKIGTEPWRCAATISRRTFLRK